MFWLVCLTAPGIPCGGGVGGELRMMPPGESRDRGPVLLRDVFCASAVQSATGGKFEFESRRQESEVAFGLRGEAGRSLGAMWGEIGVPTAGNHRTIKVQVVPETFASATWHRHKRHIFRPNRRFAEIPAGSNSADPQPANRCSGELRDRSRASSPR